MDDQEYLEPGFDPMSLTMPRLRSILLAHNVNYPASAKKQQLVDLFSQNVASQARKIKSDSLRVKRSSKGIVDVPSATSSVRDEEEEDDAPATATRSSRRTTRARTEEAEEVKPTPRRGVRHSTAPPEGTPRRVSSKHARAAEKVEEEEEPEPKRPSSRKSRMSAVTPVVKREREDTSPFSNDNVFQSGGSPPPTTENRRKTTQNTAEEARRRRSRGARRKTEEFRPTGQQMDGAVVPTRRTFELPLSKVKKEEVDPDEEFTPEEQMDLIQAEQAGEVVPARRRPARPASNTAKTAPIAILSVFLVAFGALWSEEKFKVGYCGVGVPSYEIGGVEIPDWADPARPQCEPCPPHAMCNDRFETVCEPGFVVTQHPLSLGGMLPFPPTCEPDSERARRVDAVKERAIEELREQNALYECGEAGTPDIQESALKSAVVSHKRKSMSQEEFDDLWAEVEGELLKSDEITAGNSGTLRSHSTARIPLGCALRRSLVETLRRYVWSIVSILTILSGGAYTSRRITTGREEEERAKMLASQALQKLSLQASLHASEPDVWGEDYISVAQMRDDVLRDEFSATRRKKLWDKVQAKVEHNSNVRPIVRESRSGDVGRTWQWVGAIGRLDSPGSADNSGYGGYGDRRKSGSRVSFGGERWIEPEGDRSHSEMSEVSRWKEQGQYY